jgi:hypothetical protein
MTTDVSGLVGRMGILATSVLAIIVLVTPLALWVSWTGPMLIGVMVLGVVSAALYCVLDRVETGVGRDPRATLGTIDRLSDQAAAELSNLQPFVYHNRLSVEGRLQRTLDKVKETLRDRR